MHRVGSIARAKERRWVQSVASLLLHKWYDFVASRDWVLHRQMEMNLQSQRPCPLNAVWLFRWPRPSGHSTPRCVWNTSASACFSSSSSGSSAKTGISPFLSQSMFHLNHFSESDSNWKRFLASFAIKLFDLSLDNFSSPLNWSLIDQSTYSSSSSVHLSSLFQTQDVRMLIFNSNDKSSRESSVGVEREWNQWDRWEQKEE